MYRHPAEADLRRFQQLGRQAVNYRISVSCTS
jgi:hypothetical protein